jgi:hypothetical protein
MRYAGMLYLGVRREKREFAQKFLDIGTQLYDRGEETGAFLFAWKSIHAAEREGNNAVLRRAEILAQKIGE